jgi:hypothetical protein
MFRDGNAGNWRFETAMPKPLTHMAVAVVGDEIFFCGGFNNAHPGESVSDFFSFNKITKSWTTHPNLPGDRAGGGLVLLGTNNGSATFLYAGGVDRPGRSNDNLVDYGSAWEITLSANGNEQWKDRAPMPNPRNHMGATTAVCANGRSRHFYVGGQHKEMEANGNQASMSEYDSRDGAWSERKPLPVGTGHISSSVVAYGCGLFVIGGVVDSGNGGQNSDAVWWYSVEEDDWIQIGSLPFGVKTPVCDIRWNNMVCAAGGQTFTAWLGLK